jgi:hypothetical protein
LLKQFCKSLNLKVKSSPNAVSRDASAREPKKDTAGDSSSNYINLVNAYKE